MKSLENFELIVTIVNKGWSEEILRASRAAGAAGGTILHGRGSGIHEAKKLFGIAIEPEKEIILTAICREKSDQVLEAIVKAGNLDRPGAGIAFVLDISRIAGICHLCDLHEHAPSGG